MKGRARLIAILMATVFMLTTAIPTHATPSNWAAEAVEEAIERNLVPTHLQSDFSQATTRAEFAALAVAFYQSIHGPFDDRIGVTGRIHFDDTDDINVERAAYLGIVQGIGNNRFDPHGNLTREQAAVLISRLATAIGQPLPQVAPTFADNASISSWAIEGVGSVQAIGIMGGIGNNMFAPLGQYTREQSIVTMMRLYLWIHDYNNVEDDIPETTPAPTSHPTPEPTPQPTPEPTPQPTPQPTPEPTPQPTPEPTPTPPPPAREAPFAYTTSNITIPNHRLSSEERQTWIDEYNANGGASAFELEVIRLVNVERANYGLAPLAICHTLMLASRFYAQTMANLNTNLGHSEGPYGGSFATADAFGDRMVRMRAANGIAGRWTPEAAVEGWMNSPGHRANILHPNATRIGTGFHLGGRWGVFGYQLFGGGTATPIPS